MSGGVDSSLSALLMKSRGYEVIGVTFLVNDHTSDKEAKAAAEAIGIKHYTLDLRDAFRREVISEFISEYERGSTPNPCVTCNRHIKFPYLFKFMREMACDVAVTGHYARISKLDGGYFLCCGTDAKKDQSYMLWGLDRTSLEFLQFPLGEMTKDEVRAAAEEYKLPSAHTKDSQDICFIPNGDYAAYITDQTKKDYPRGAFYSTDGELLASAGRVIDYTVGQRRGLGYAAGERIFVISKDPENGRIVLGEEKLLYKDRVTAKNINLFCELPAKKLSAKIRYGKNATPATVTVSGENTITAVFDDAVRAPTSGQSLVIYDGDTVLGGGVIV